MIEQNLDKLETSKVETPEVKPDAGGVQIKVEHSAVIETPITPEMPAPPKTETAVSKTVAAAERGIKPLQVIEVISSKLDQSVDSAVLYAGRELMKEAA